MPRGLHILGEIPRGRQKSDGQASVGPHLLYLDTMWERGEEYIFCLALPIPTTHFPLPSPTHPSRKLTVPHQHLQNEIMSGLSHGPK